MKLVSMENKNVGYLIIGIALLIVVIIFIFNSALKEIVESSCTMAGHGDSCPMYDTITTQTYLALVIAGVVLLVGLFLIFTKQTEKVVVKTVEKKIVKKKVNLTGLKVEERKVYELVFEDKAIFQADLIEKTGFGKAKMTRIIDRLEGKGLVERKRRGMTNVVVVK